MEKNLKLLISSALVFIIFSIPQKTHCMDSKRSDWEADSAYNKNINQNRYKAKQKCDYFNGYYNSCRYGNNCWFSHGEIGNDKIVQKKAGRTTAEEIEKIKTEQKQPRIIVHQTERVGQEKPWVVKERQLELIERKAVFNAQESKIDEYIDEYINLCNLLNELDDESRFHHEDCNLRDIVDKINKLLIRQ